MKIRSKIIGLLFLCALIATALTTLTVSASAADGDVAKITKTSDGTDVGSYANFDDALSNWPDGTTLTLLDNVTYEGDITVTDKNVTLDLGGKSLTINSSYNILVGNINYDNFIVTPGTLTVSDSTEGGKIISEERIIVYDTLYFTNATLEKGINVESNGTAYISGGTIHEIDNSYNAIYNSGSLYVSGGTITGRYAIWTYSGSTTVISGSPTIIGKDMNSYNPGGSIYNQGTLSIYGEPTLSGEGHGEIITHSPITLGTQPKDSSWKISLGDMSTASELGVFAKPAENFTIDPAKFACIFEGYDLVTNENGELVIHQHSDDNLDHVCDKECGAVTVNIDKHVDGDDQDHLCDYGCKQIADEGCHDSNKDGDHKCDECGADNISQHLDSNNDGDHLCDNGCGAVLENCTPDADDGDCTTDIKCSVCKKTLTAGADSHTGGTATCTAKAKCAVCQKEYGEILAHSHSKEFKLDENNHWNECVCGDKANTAPHSDTDYDAKCDSCGYAMPLDDPSAPTPDLPEPSAPTEKEETETADSEKPTEKGGCGSSVAISALAIVGIIGTAIVLKKKED